MNFSIIFYIIGWILKIEAGLMLLPCAAAVVYRERSGICFLITMAVCLAIGFPLTIKSPKKKVFYAREGFVTVALSWFIMSIMGATPFVISSRAYRSIWGESAEIEASASAGPWASEAPAR